MEIGEKFTTSKSYMVVGNFTEGEAFICSTPEMARELFCNILNEQPLEKYFTEEQLILFKSLVKHRKMKKAYRHWRACASDADLRIEVTTTVSYKYATGYKNVESYGLSPKTLFGI